MANNLAAAAMLLALAATPSAARAQPPGAAVDQQAPGVYRALLGDFKVIALSDGTTPQPFATLLHGGVLDADVQKRGDAKGQYETSINVYLIDTGSAVILVDTGAGGLFGPCCGRLPQALSSAGYSVGDIDAVLLTHIHGDHSAGLAKSGKAVFPKAQILVAKAELDYWMSDKAMAAAKPAQQPWFALGRSDLAPYAAAGRVRTFEPGAELFPGVHAQAAPGHTPGHTIYTIESAGSRMMIVGDLVHFADVQLPNPSVTIDYDYDEAQAAKTRLRILADLANGSQIIAAPHISFPGLGRVSRQGKGFSWTPVAYSGQVGQLDGRSNLAPAGGGGAPR